MDYRNFFDFGGHNFGVGGAALVILLVIWELTWKGFGLWKSAKANQSGWFFAILILNTLGILPILYLYVFSPKVTDKR